MLLTLEVMGAQAERLGSNRRRLFVDGGGTIGRVDGNDWVLPDQFVSSRHAQVSYQDGTFYIVDANSSNGVFVNSTDNRLTPGVPYPLKSGDRIFIDPFEIHASVIAVEPSRPAPLVESPLTMQIAAPKAQRPAVPDPFAIEPEVPYVGTVPAPRQRAPAPIQNNRILPDSSEADPQAVDPMELLGLPDKRKAPARPSAADLRAGSPLQSHYAPPPISTPPARPVPAPPRSPDPAHTPLIPENYNPLAQTGFERPPPKPAPPKPPLPPPSRPAASTLQQAAPPPAPPPRQERDREPPRRAAPPPPVAAPPAQRTSPVEPRVAERRPVPPAAPPPDRRQVQAADERAPASASPRPGKGARIPVSQLPAGQGTGQGETRFDFETLLESAGLDSSALTPELAGNFGAILRAVVDGLMDVLRARDEVREAFRLRVTSFQQRENNPLKFSANTEDALHNLLVKRNAAYLGPVESFEEAFEDLRAHQVAMLAGLRAAYESMLAEFEPEHLEARFERYAKSGGLLSGSARQRYWDHYLAHYRETVADADTSFRKLFGEAFGRAYDEQVKRLKAKRRGERS